MTRRSWPLLAAATLIQIGCGASTWAPIDHGNLPSQETYPDADAVLLHEHDTLRFFEADDGIRLRRTIQRRVLILAPNGSKRANLAMGYDRTFSVVEQLRGRIVRPDGDTTTYGLADVGDHPAYQESILYHDTRVLIKEVPPLVAGTIVEWELTLVERDATWRSDRFGFGNTIPVASAQFEVIVPAGWSLDHQATQMWKPITFPPRVRKTDNAAYYSWQQTDILAVPRESSGPGLIDTVPVVSVRLGTWTEKGVAKRAFDSMEAYGRWMYELQDGTSAATPEIRETVERVLAETTKEPRARAGALYRWVQDNIRYVAVEVGIGGWRPHTAKDVFDNRYGDCKDKANLLRTMLRIANINSYLAELYAHRGVARPFVLPNVGNSNHAILAVELADEIVLADPTTRTVPFGALPVSDQGTEVLLIHPVASRIIRTPTAPPEANRKTLVIEIEKIDGVTAKGRAHLTASGRFGSILRAQLLQTPEGKRKDLFKGWAWLKNTDAKKPSFETKSHDTLQATAKIDLSRIGTRAQDRLVFKPSEVIVTPGTRLERIKRTQPVVFSNAVARDTELRLSIDGYEHGPLPEPTEVTTPFGTFHQHWSIEGTTLVMKSRFERPMQVVASDRYDELLAFFDAVLDARGRGVVLRPQKGASL